MKNRIIALFGLLLLGGCQKDKPEEEINALTSTFNLKINYKVDTDSLRFDTIMYSNQAGNSYSVTKLEYFISSMSLIKPDNSLVPVLTYHYINARTPSINSFEIKGIPDGDYIGISMCTGLDSAHNISWGLPSCMENNGMEWPEVMGGGYHHMKMEGNYITSTGHPGFTMHLGGKQNIVNNLLIVPLNFHHNNLSKTITMNLNEWFRNPLVYDFNTDGSASMSDSSCLAKLSVNGSDIWTIQ